MGSARLGGLALATHLAFSTGGVIFAIVSVTNNLLILID